jgi:hypothetical protein
VTPTHEMNWYAGWGMILTSFLVGAVIGLHFHREDFLGGYTSFRRRILRLGHIALAALGLMNVAYALSPWPARGLWQADAAGIAFLAGGILMPAVCFLSAWREVFRNLFALPVIALVTAVVLTLMGGG